jgi:hypothetical protein
MLDSSSDSAAAETAPTGVEKTMAGRGRLANSAYRTRKHIEPAEVQAIAEAARVGRQHETKDRDVCRVAACNVRLQL